MNNYIIAVAALFLAIPVQGRIITVDDDGPADFAMIQAAVEDANDGDIIILFPGTYTGPGNCNIDFSQPHLTITSVDPNDPYIVAATIVDCNGFSRAFSFQGAYYQDCYWVLDGLTIKNGCSEQFGGAIFCEQSSPTIRNCIFRENKAGYRDGDLCEPCEDDCPDDMYAPSGSPGPRYFGWGGAIYCRQADPNIVNCAFRENSAPYGGAVFCDERSNPRISDSIFESNKAEYDGGAIYGSESGPTITNCVITSNLARDGDGGGIYGMSTWSESFRIDRCTIRGNHARNNGGAVSISGWEKARLSLTNSVLLANIAQEGYGGAIYCDSGLRMTFNVTGSSIIANFAGRRTGGIYNSHHGDTFITNSILWGNSDVGGTNERTQIDGGESQVTFSCIQDFDPNYIHLKPGSFQIIADDPVFVRDPDNAGDGWGDDPETPDIDEGSNDDYGDIHLQPGSPCIDAGAERLWWFKSVDADIDGQERIMGWRTDIGADEFYTLMITVTKPTTGQVWTAASKHTIAWKTDLYEKPLDVRFSTDAGSTWSTIAAQLPHDAGFDWDLPETIDSNQCVIWIVPSAADANVISIKSGLFTIKPYTPGPAVESKWKTLGGDFQRTGLSEYSGPELGCIKWQFHTDAPVSASPTVGFEDRIHIPCENGILYTLNAEDGTIVWTYDAHSEILTAPTIGPDGTVYLGCQSGKLHAVDTLGQLRWTHKTEGFIYSSPAVSPEGNIYVGSQDGFLYALAPDGTQLWTFETEGPGQIPNPIFASPALAEDGTIYIAGLYDPNLYALDPIDGSVKWSHRFESPIDPHNPNSRTSLGHAFASPVIAKNNIYISSRLDPTLYSIDRNTGTLLWSTPLAPPCDLIHIFHNICPGWSQWFGIDLRKWASYKPSDFWSEPVIGPDGTIYVALDPDPYLRAIDPNGSVKWVTRLGARGSFSLTVGNDGLVYAAADDGHLYVVTPDGNLIAEVQTHSPAGAVVIGPDGTVILADENSDVWAIENGTCENRELLLHIPQDINADGNVDLNDLALFAADWLACSDTYPDPFQRSKPACDYQDDGIYLEGDVDKDLYVDFTDFAMLANRWLYNE